MNYSLLPPGIKSRFYEPRPEWRQRLADRRKLIVEMRTGGMTVSQIAATMNVTRQRVYQVLKKEGAK